MTKTPSSAKSRPSSSPKALKTPRLLWALLYLLPPALFFSFHPVISLGASSSMNLELSLPLIWLVLFDVVAFLALISLRSKNNPKSSPQSNLKTSPKNTPSKPLHEPPKNFPGISDRRIFLFSLFPFFLTLSVFWSRNPLRGLLTAGIIWLLFFAIFAIMYLLPLLAPPKNLRRNLLLSLFISTALICVFCFVQSILDTCGLPRSATLMCAGCTYLSFGFPHPSGFAIEPQFMGNLLLAPTLTVLYLLVFKTSAQKPSTKSSAKSAETTPATSSHLVLTLAACLFSTTLFFTFSRGAIYAYAVALLALFIFALLRRTFRPALIVIPVATFLLSLGLQGTFAALGPTSETFTSAVTKSLHQLSLGIIDLRSLASPEKTPEKSQEASDKSPEKIPENTSPEASNQPSTTPPDQLDADLDKIADDLPSSVGDLIHDLEQETAHFEGYVAESTNIRLSLNETALATSLQSPATLLFGVGLGGAGTAIFEAFPDKIASPKEIVQNQTFSLLLETGLLGLFFAHFFLVLAFLAPLLPWWFIDGKSGRRFTPAELRGKNFLSRQLYRLQTSEFWSHPALPLLAALILAYLVTLSFFSGLPNALQIYLMPPLLFFIFRPAPAPGPSPK